MPAGTLSVLIMPPPLGGHNARLCLSVAYIWPKSRTERPRKTKFGTEVAHVTRESDTTFKVKRSKVNLQGRGHIVAASHTACYPRRARSALGVDTVLTLDVCLYVCMYVC